MTHRKNYSTGLPFAYSANASDLQPEEAGPVQPHRNQNGAQIRKDAMTQAGSPAHGNGQKYLDVSLPELDGTAISRVNSLRRYQSPGKEDEGYGSLADESPVEDRSSAIQAVRQIQAGANAKSEQFFPGASNGNILGVGRDAPILRHAEDRGVLDDSKEREARVNQISATTSGTSGTEIPPVPVIPDRHRPKKTVSKDGVLARKSKANKEPVFEQVEGAKLDARPPSYSNSHNSEEVIPEIEASDIRSIPRQKVHLDWESSVVEDDASISSSRSQISEDGAASLSWSRNSGSSSSTSTNTITKSYQHASAEYSLSVDGRDVVGSPDQVPALTNTLTTPEPSQTNDTGAVKSPPSGSTMTRKVDLAVIQEEDGESLVDGNNSAAAPPPVVKGVKDSDIDGRVSKLGIITSGQNGQASLRAAQSPPKVLSASGIGDDSHIYETVPEASISDSSSPTRVDTSSGSTAASSASSISNGPLDHVHHGLSKVAHAVHDKVKKSVSFSPVDDVRLRTPSPSRSGSVRMRNGT
ncbi:hypothetical protein LTR41_003621 [Exophiala xenobiotica]|nr:hypothetical protein LTR41_003621 [Exophiala xenobiotica]KAK5447151.1 hypothetical protein LTR18_002730 [Exophiala xenobiotica]